MYTEYSVEWMQNFNPGTWDDVYIGTVRRAIFRGIARDSGVMEDAKMNYDQWELFATAIQSAYERGLSGKPLDIYSFLKWHGGILPFGGTLRQSGAVSAEMGQSFNPAAYSDLPRLMPAFVTRFNDVLARSNAPHNAMAQLHFEEWQTHFFPDGNKRHCRLLSVYACGLFGLPPVRITLNKKSAYLDALAAGDVDDLALLFASCAD